MLLPPLGLYIHLPWCERKCPYCDFNSHETSIVPEQRYIDVLLQDLHEDLPLLQGRTVDTLFIGGGTPSLFSASGVEKLLQGIKNVVPLSATLESTMEANPGSADAEKFRSFREAGVNRLSIGIQSFDNALLQSLGRVHNSDQAHAAIEYARDAGFPSINLDLMHGLPEQTLETAEKDLQCAIAIGPGHLSWYQLTIEPNTVFHTRPPTLPVEDLLADIQQHGEQLLAASGYAQYEVSAYSRGGFNCQHNRNYWSFGDYLGIGAGAHSKISFANGHIERYAKRRQPEEYMSPGAGGFVASTRTLELSEVVGEFMMNALRLNDGFTLQQFGARTGLSCEQLEPQLESLCRRELLQRDGDAICATGIGRRFLDSVVSEFLPD